MTIDWNAPLEAYHSDGRVEEIEYFDKIQDRYSDDGSCSFNSGWRIRNRTEKPAPQYPVELVERMVSLVRDMAKVGRECFKDAGTVCERDYAAACDIEEDLPQPADADLLLAREIAADQSGEMKGHAKRIMAGELDKGWEVSIALAAIKRIHTQTQDVSDVKGS